MRAALIRAVYTGCVTMVVLVGLNVSGALPINMSDTDCARERAVLQAGTESAATWALYGDCDRALKELQDALSAAGYTCRWVPDSVLTSRLECSREKSDGKRE